MYIIVNSRNAILLCIIFVSFISTLLSSQDNNNFYNNNNDNNNINNLKRATKSFLSRIPIPVTELNLFDSFKSDITFEINNRNNNFLTSSSSSDEFAATGSGVLQQFITVDPVVATIQQLPSSHHITPTNEATTDSPTLLYDVIGKSDIQHMMLDHHEGHQISVKQSSSKRASLFDFPSKLGEISWSSSSLWLFTSHQLFHVLWHFSCSFCIDIEPFEDYSSKIVNTAVSNPLLQSSSSSVVIDDPPSTVTLHPTRSLISSSTDSPLSSLFPHQSSSRSSAASLSSEALSSSKSTTTTTSGLFDYLHHVAVSDLKASDVPLVASSTAMDESLNKLTVSSPSLSSTYSQHSQSFVVASSSSSLPYTRPINCSINQVFSILINMYLIDQSLLYHLWSLLLYHSWSSLLTMHTILSLGFGWTSLY